MEETKSGRKTSKRKPFTDLSNNIPSSLPSSQSSSSSLIKPQTISSLSLPIKSLLNHPNSSLSSKCTATVPITNDNVSNEKKKKEKGENQSNKANPSSVLSPSPKTPTGSGIGDCVDFEPWTVHHRKHTTEKRRSKGKEIAEPLTCSFKTKTPELSTVYHRRHTAEKRKRKSKGKEIAKPLSCSFDTKMPELRKRKDGYGDIGLSKSCPVPRKKKQFQEKAEINVPKLDLPQDFIDKQKAYFAEIDSFELEEEVASADELE